MSQPSFQPLYHSLAQSVSHWFVYNDTRDCAKGIANIKVNDRTAHLIVGGIWARYDLPLVSLQWLFPVTISFFVCLGMASRGICSIIFPGPEVRLTSPELLRFSCPPFLTTGLKFNFIQQAGSFHNHHGLSTIVDSILLMTLARSFSYLRCNLSGRMDFCTSCWLVFPSSVCCWM